MHNTDHPLPYSPESTTTTEDARQFEAIKQEAMSGMHVVALGLILAGFVGMFALGLFVGMAL
jgi:hypothetical protein